MVPGMLAAYSFAMEQDVQISGWVEVRAWRIALAGLCATLVGIGLGRFAYTPLVPALIAARWFSASDVLYLSAANLAGYLAGALTARQVAVHIAPVTLLRASMALVSVACFACSTPLSVAWYFAWRLASGLAGGFIMVLVAATVLPHTPPTRRGLVGGLIFTGVGLGIAASGTLVPLLLRIGVAPAWWGLGALSALLTAISWSSWPRGRLASMPPPPGGTHHPHSRPRVNALVICYGFAAAALVPHMVFLVDFVARGLGEGLVTGARDWVCYGVGAMLGPLLSGALADRIGFGRALRLAFCVQAAAVITPAVTANAAALIISSMIVGGLTPGVVPLVLGRAHELIPRDADAQRRAWSAVTASFALCQALAAYGFAYVFAVTGDYLLVFKLGALAGVCALALDLAASSWARRQPG